MPAYQFLGISEQTTNCGVSKRADAKIHGTDKPDSENVPATGPAEIEQMKAAILAAYLHLDTYGIVKGDERQIDSQYKVFELLRPFVTYPAGRL